MSTIALKYARDAAQRAMRDWHKEHAERGQEPPAWLIRRLEQAEAVLAAAEEREKSQGKEPV